LGKKGAFELFVPKGDKPVEVDAVVGASFLITPMARKKVGLLDERYFMYFEDLDYCRRVNKLGLKVYYLPSAKIIHYHGASGKKIVKPAFQWKRLIPSSKIYHGALTHYLINFIIWLGQKIKKIF
jgi:GT2 family glycosyltransferase